MRSRALALIAIVLAVAALHLVRPVVLPFVTGIMIAALGWPMLQWLRQRLHRSLALLLTILTVSIVLLTILAGIGWSTVSIATDLRERRDRIDALHRRASAVVGPFGIEVPPFELGDAGRDSSGGASDTARAGGERAPGAGGGGRSLAGRLGVGVYSMLGYLGLAVGFAALILAELHDARERIRLRFDPKEATRILEVSSEVAQSIRRYFKVKSITSAIAGIATGLLSLAFGIEFAAVWALLAFLFEYVPTIGSILAVVPPVTYAFVQFEGIAKPLAALGVFTVVQLFLGNYVDPRIEGRLLSISPLVVLLAIVFGAWLWGAPGSLLGVPLIVAVTVVARHYAPARWAWAILTEPDEEERRDARREDGRG